MSTPEKTTYALIAANVAVFLGWRLPALVPFMRRHFLHQARSSRHYTMLTSAFSHENIMHIGFNMLAMRGFFIFLQDRKGMSPEEAVFFLCSAAVFSSWGSQLFKWLVPSRGAAASLGASGGVWAVFASTAILFPSLKASIIFIPGVFMPLGYLVPAFVALDVLGLLLRWRMFDHAAHLAGALAGVLYTQYGFEMWTAVQNQMFKEKLNEERREAGSSSRYL
ncbi:hypothetical protein BC831DRAFT_401775 [Entophlyctis helioformis]|nr:hypothetical protein BC831DRAFT_401775 [Entophlyctis helioformis]